MSDSRFSDAGHRFRRAEDTNGYGSNRRVGFGRERLICLSEQPDTQDAPLESAELFALHQYWLSRRWGRRFPSRADIDPLDIPYLLGNIMLVDVQWEPRSFSVRLYGSGMVARLGSDLTGEILRPTPPSELRVDVIRCCDRVLQDQSPLIEKGRDKRYGRAWTYEALWLPLAAGDVIDMLLRAEICRPVQLAHADAPPDTLGKEGDHEFDAAVPTV